MRFSRRTLNIIIFCCLGIISWIHLGGTDPEIEPLEPLNLPALNTSHWQSWQSREGVRSYHQQVSAEQGQLRLIMQDKQINWSLPAQDWSQALQQHLAEITTTQPLSAQTLLLQGPWSEQEMQLISAYLIDQMALSATGKPSMHLSQCEQRHPAGSLWFRQHWSSTADLDLTKGLPKREQWQDFRLQQTRQLRQQWLSNAGQLDIQTDIAYHRPPAHYYQQLYQQLGDSQKTAAQDYLSCKQQIAAQ